MTGAARRLGLSPSAASRTLARLRAATGDPLLVRAGRGLIRTPRAEALRDPVRALVRETRAVLSPQADDFDPARLERTFVIRASEGFVGLLAGPLVAAVSQAAPRARLRFAPKPEKDAAGLREGQADLEIGTPGLTAPEIRTRLIFRDRFIGAVRLGHPLLAGPLSPERYAACGHVVASRHAVFTGPVDDALAALGLVRRIVAVAPGFPDALRIARDTDLVALAPASCLESPLARARPLAHGLVGFALPVATPPIAVSALWHPRLDADPAHRWLRELVMAVGRAELAAGPSFAYRGG